MMSNDPYAKFYDLVDPPTFEAPDAHGPVSAVRWWRRAMADVIDDVAALGAMAVVVLVLSWSAVG